jgi:hypothetical protein
VSNGSSVRPAQLTRNSGRQKSTINNSSQEIDHCLKVKGQQWHYLRLALAKDQLMQTLNCMKQRLSVEDMEKPMKRFDAQRAELLQRIATTCKK